ncbi:MAG: phosphate ABC transporter permease PstA [Terriglobales bacterium]
MSSVALQPGIGHLPRGRAHQRWRRFRNAFMLGLTGLCTLLVLIPLFLILYYVVRQGLPGLHWSFLANAPKPVGEPDGGMGNALVGTLELLGLAIVVGIPLGIGAGVYVAEFRGETFAHVVRFAADVLNGIPTIVTGMFIYGLVVVPLHHFSGWAGGLALAIILVPVVLRTTDEVLRTIPVSYREAALALGASRWDVIWRVVLRAAQPGLVSASLLGISRIAGETAPLLFTALNNSFWSFKLNQPMASLTVQIYNFAIAPYDEWHALAWTGALTLILLVLSLNILARLWSRWRSPRRTA